MPRNFSGGGGENCLPIRVQANAISAFDAQRNAIRFRSRADDVVRLESPLRPVVDEIDSWIDRAKLHARIFRHISSPFLRIVPDEVIGVAHMGACGLWDRMGSGSYKRAGEA